MTGTRIRTWVVVLLALGSSPALALPGSPLDDQEPALALRSGRGEPPAEQDGALQLSVELGRGLHLGQGVGVLDLHLGWRTGRWELGVMLENLANLEGWDVTRDERTLFAVPAWRDPAPAEDLVLAPSNPWNARLYVMLAF
jgi:hypothetical protein